MGDEKVLIKKAINTTDDTPFLKPQATPPSQSDSKRKLQLGRSVRRFNCAEQ